ncbi:Uncharacterised protein [Yersinia enterocolitica]|uniref:Uncharacterized protein n=1 Tax=Yersinia enterocolitica TaxID=630 RepID=A0ABM9SJN5_YEREN|nr:Uncharacterised protein [Yersinia enterocolitica]CNG61335.1 Uncharacterised protein [Yersinia enterocolitica]
MKLMSNATSLYFSKVASRSETQRIYEGAFNLLSFANKKLENVDVSSNCRANFELKLLRLTSNAKSVSALSMRCQYCLSTPGSADHIDINSLSSMQK